MDTSNWMLDQTTPEEDQTQEEEVDKETQCTNTGVKDTSSDKSQKWRYLAVSNLPKAEIGKIVVKNRNLCVERGTRFTNIFWG